MQTIEEIHDYANSRRLECQQSKLAYRRWLAILTPFNLMFIGLGGSLSFIGGAEILSSGDTIMTNLQAGIAAVSGGLLTGIHKLLKCEKHQAECKRLLAQFSYLESRYSRLPEYSSSTDEAGNFIRKLGERYDELIESAEAFPPSIFYDTA